MEFPHADPLANALEFLRISEATYHYCSLAAPWGLLIAAECPKFHAVTSGRCWLEVEGTCTQALEPGDFVVFPHGNGNGHRLYSDPSASFQRPGDLSSERISKRCELFRIEGEGPVTTTVCGDLNFNHPAAEWLVPLLPKVIHARAPVDYSMEWLYGTLRFMAAEAANLRPGGEAILTRLSDILVIHAIRSWIEQMPEQQAGWLSALRDLPISRAIGLMHQIPQENWTVNSLARAVGMSRSAFSERFSKLVGEPAMHYLSKYRMHLAADYLKQGDRGIDEIAFRLGYQSVEGFSRAFKRFRGLAPGSVRDIKSPATTAAIQ